VFGQKIIISYLRGKARDCILYPSVGRAQFICENNYNNYIFD
jgi:hypothetical protein